MDGHTRNEASSQRASHKRKRDSSSPNGRLSTRSTQSHAANNGALVAAGIRDTTIETGARKMDAQNSIEENVVRHVSNNQDSSVTAAAALAANMPSLSIPRPADVTFQEKMEEQGQRINLDEDPFRPAEMVVINGHPSASQSAGGDASESDRYPTDGRKQPGSDQGLSTRPPIGSEEWNRLRKNSHKEVERRRREMINEGINELEKIIPEGDKHKGAILMRGVNYIEHLQERDRRNTEKWKLEKMLTDQAITELTSSVDRLKDELLRTRHDAEQWKSVAQAAGLSVAGEDGEEASGNITMGDQGPPRDQRSKAPS